MKDVQNHPDTRNMPIDRVGVCDLRYPITVMDRENRQQSTTARLSMSVSLPHDFKGTHMSRFIEILNTHRGEITMRTLPHNQRGHVTVEIRSRPSQGSTPELVWIEELVAVAETSASAPLYPLLKREDERHVTMQAYDNPAFVEDIVREVAIRLQNDERIVWFRVHALNQESIHNHNAFAQIAWSRP